MELDTKTDKITTIATGNFYLPDVNNGYIYYIDMGNGRKLTRILMSTGKKEILQMILLLTIIFQENTM